MNNYMPLHILNDLIRKHLPQIQNVPKHVISWRLEEFARDVEEYHGIFTDPTMRPPGHPPKTYPGSEVEHWRKQYIQLVEKCNPNVNPNPLYERTVQSKVRKDMIQRLSEWQAAYVRWRHWS